MSLLQKTKIIQLNHWVDISIPEWLGPFYSRLLNPLWLERNQIDQSLAVWRKCIFFTFEMFFWVKRLIRASDKERTARTEIDMDFDQMRGTCVERT